MDFFPYIGDYFLKEEKEDLKEYKLDLDYIMLTKELKEIRVTSKASQKLGVSFKEKMRNIKEICLKKCGFDCSKSNKNKERQKLLRYIKEYERYGEEVFISNHIKKNDLKKKGI